MTPSGTTISVTPQGSEQPPRYGHTSVIHQLTVASTGGQSRKVEVAFDEPDYVNTLQAGNHLPELKADDRARLAMIATLRSIDQDPTFFEGDGALRLKLGFDEIQQLGRAARLSNESIRRYLSRRLHLAWENGALDDFVDFDDADLALTGASPADFLRNLQVLEQGEYVEMVRTMGAGLACFSARAKSKLLREVERYGAAHEDVESATEYEMTLASVPGLASREAAIVLERGRYERARTPEELASVFRAIAPVVEGLVRDLLRADGCKKEFSSLGPMIGEMVSRGLGTVGLRAQLNAVLTGGRDISLHGEELPTPVLRIVTETCFGLLPQLAGLLPV